MNSTFTNTFERMVFSSDIENTLKKGHWWDLMSDLAQESFIKPIVIC